MCLGLEVILDCFHKVRWFGLCRGSISLCLVDFGWLIRVGVIIVPI